MPFQIKTVEVRQFDTLFTLNQATPTEQFRHIVFIRNENRVMRDILTGMFGDPGHAFDFIAVKADDNYPPDHCHITSITRFIEP